MNTTAYTPEPGSLAERVSTWLRRNREEELTPRDIATKFDVPVQGLHFTLRDAMHHGWITRQGSNGSYSAGPLLPVAGALGGEPAKPAPLVGSRRSRRLRHLTPTGRGGDASAHRPTRTARPSGQTCRCQSAPASQAAARTSRCWNA